MKRKILAAVILSLALAGCGASNEDDNGPEQTMDRCDAGLTEYLAFDSANHAAQDARLAAFDAMTAKFAEAKADLSTVAAKADEILAMYEDPSTNIRAKVQGRTDMHFTGTDAEVGAQLDAVFMGALNDLRDSNTAFEVDVARQAFQKAGIYRFLYLSVMQELAEPSRKHFDEAYGYFGSGETNSEAGRRGLAKVATDRDAAYGTTYEAEIFDALLEGNCAIDNALTAAGSETIELGADAAYDGVVAKVDTRLQAVFMLSIAHELEEIEENKTANLEKARLELFEALAFFQTVKPYLATGTTEEQAFAASFETALTSAIDLAIGGDDSWVAGFDAAGFQAQIEAMVGVSAQG